jgi:DNA-binding LacI/PurR family transcriptional regulator
MSVSKLNILSVSDQIVAHLRSEILSGKWRGLMPGRNELARLFDVGISSVEDALRQLETEGLLAAQGAGRQRRIVENAQGARRRQLRIAILSYESSSLRGGIFSEVAHELREVGHDAFFTNTSLLEMDMNVRRVAKLVKQTEADAWIVCSAPRQITEWFATLPMPAFALFGRRRGVRMASVGPDKSPALVEATRRLIGSGHRRIVMLCRPDRRRPAPGAPERAFLAELAAHGIEPGPYHLPDWEDGVDGFQTQLEMLFDVTPPTALIVDELRLFVATQQLLLRKQLRVPEDVSLVSMESDPALEWCRPSVARVRWDQAAVIRRVTAWANNVARGKEDRRETLTRAQFINGETIGPAKAL